MVMLVNANKARERVDTARNPLGDFLPIPSTEFGLRTGDWDNQDDWCIWLAGYGVRPAYIKHTTLAGTATLYGFEVVESVAVPCGPADMESPPEPRIEPRGEFLNLDLAIGYTVGRAMDDWAVQWLAKVDRYPLLGAPSFLKRQAD